MFCSDVMIESKQTLNDRTALIFSQPVSSASDALANYQSNVDNEKVELELVDIYQKLSETMPEFYLFLLAKQIGYAAASISKGEKGGNPNTIKIGVPININHVVTHIVGNMNSKRAPNLSPLTFDNLTFEVEAPELRKLLDSDITSGLVRVHFYDEGCWMRMHVDNFNTVSSHKKCKSAVTFLGIQARVKAMIASPSQKKNSSASSSSASSGQ